MPLNAGETLGPYEIVSPLGAGGMGEVYKARDTRLDRSVAIKVLPEHIAQRQDARARFEREARSVGSLNHPHICTLYDIGPNYMVMELIEGETLAARIEKGPIPLEQAIQLATQIADALDRAHRAGVTHRDVKPQNIMLTRDGVKVLDFGLAKSTASATPAPTEATLTKVLTTEGTVLGTPQYMAPEQFEGREADARSDIWAFGAVLYEMVTGQKAFQGKSYTSLVAAILGADPPPMAVKPFTPSWLERLVRRCLEKDPDDRWQSMRDVVIELRSPPPEPAALAAPPKAARLAWAVAGALALTLTVAGVLLYNATRPAPPRPLIRLSVEMAPGMPLARSHGQNARGGGHMFALSPDGTRLAVTLHGADGKVRLYTRLLEQSQLMPLEGTEYAYSPFFSPAGDWIGFFADGKLKKIAVEGRIIVTLCDSPQGRGASWGDDGNIIAALNVGTGLTRIPANGGTPVPLTKRNADEATHRYPHILPGSQTVLFTAATRMTAYGEANIDAVSLRTGERKTILSGGFSPAYVAAASGSNGTGHLIYEHDSKLFAVPFDPVRLVTTGSPAPVIEDLSSTPNGGADFSFSQNGTFAYLPGREYIENVSISWVDTSGKLMPLQATPGQYSSPSFSPDGKRLAFSMESGKGSDIWVRDLDREAPSRLSSVPGFNTNPVWTPDGSSIVFRSENAEASGLYGIRADGSVEAKLLAPAKSATIPRSFSPDGKRLAASQKNNDSPDILTFPVEADSGPAAPGIRLGKPELFLGSPFNELSPEFSPDGRWLAYDSNEAGRPEIYVRPFPGPGGRWRVSAGGGRHPRWSRDGREIVFLGPGGFPLAAAYTAAGNSFTVAKPRTWSETRLSRTNDVIGSNYDLAPDGKHLAALTAAETKAGDRNPETLPTHLTFLLNFPGELSRKAPLN